MKKILLCLSLLLSFNSLSSTISTEQWKEVAAEDNITVYSRASENSLLPFKAEGIINSNVETVLSILKNHKRKNLWSPKLKTVKIHKKLNDNEFIFSEYYKTPWPASDREFLLKGGLIKISDSKYHLSASSIKDELLKDTSHVSADVKKISIYIEKISSNQISLSLNFMEI